MSLLLLGGASCQEVPLPDDLGDPGLAPVVRAAKAPPIMGGTLWVTRDGAHAVIADPPRDMIHIVDLEAWRETGTIQLEDGALPFRAAEDDAGLVHITLRGTGRLASIDPRTASVTRSTSVCPNPRGVAFDDTDGSLRVACAGGLLVTLPESGQATSRFIAPDLRDVLVSDGRVFVTRFRAAEVLEVDDEGWSLFGAPVSLTTGVTSREPTTAWRTLLRPTGGWLMLHQSAATDPVPGFDEPTEDRPRPPIGGYGGGGEACSAVVNPSLSMTDEEGIVHSVGVITQMALAVDAALSPDGARIAVASPSQEQAENEFGQVSVFETHVRWLSPDAEVGCNFPEPLPIDDDAVAVAYEPSGALLVQARDEPLLYRVVGDSVDRLTLEGPDASDTGFELFHYDAGDGIACASCHPEGGEDGRTWVFEDLGPRRTQALNAGLRGTEPFHWKGDMDDIHMIARQVRQGAMGGVEQADERVEALAEWLFSLRPPNPIRSRTDARAAEGEQLFGALGCASCHAGESFTSPASADLGRGPLQTPALRGVALRPPYMHDGRSSTLEDAVIDMAASTASGTTLDPQQVASLVAYLESL